MHEGAATLGGILGAAIVAAAALFKTIDRFLPRRPPEPHEPSPVTIKVLGEIAQTQAANASSSEKVAKLMEEAVGLLRQQHSEHRANEVRHAHLEKSVERVAHKVESVDRHIAKYTAAQEVA